ncbi:MAG: 4Fe-4S dicluster domain-containing protein [Planctomycetes bacterium]|nr:4Fe-4S dicluster domain-containing protein [Planctomycetota bacterium]
MSESNISYQPTDGLCYEPSKEAYWNEPLLQKEVTRAFEICHGCRMCFKYCDSFPTLFEMIDGPADGDVRKVTESKTREVMDHCFQCKLCEVQCPYTPRDGHEYQLDFPKLVHRHQAIRARKEGISVRDRLLGNPDRTARLARLSFGLANVMNRFRPIRFVMEKILGIHRAKLLPEFATTTFEKWAAHAGKVRKPGEGEAVLFQTCYVQNNEPQIGRDTVDVMERNGVELACTAGLSCCGMPAWESGDIETTRRLAKENLDRLMPWVDRDAKVIAINPTCSMMLRREWPELVAPEDRERAERLAGAVRDPGEFLWSIRNEERFNTEFRSTPGESVAYHVPCHLRAQGVGFKGRDLLRKIPGVKPKMTMECCGHDGTYAMKCESFEASCRIGKKAFDGMMEADAAVWASDCPLAALQFEQHAGTRALHPMSILARAYREDGFETKLTGTETEA